VQQWRAERAGLDAMPWYANYRIGACALLVLTAGFVYPWL
jgi:hypothetical protein